MVDDSYPDYLGKYRIEGILGRGAMGIVYKGFDPAIEREVAIKTVRADLLIGEDGEEWLDRFRREARAAGRLLHPNIVAVFEYGEHEGTPFIAMEYVEGQELHDYFRLQGPPPLDETVSIVLQILYGLEAAHNRSVVHRDIKPANIILLPDGTVKVADFGIARVDSVSRTMPGAVAGTPTYMSPEQVTGDNIDSRSDLFSTGVILYEMLSGERPFPGKTATEVMYKVVNAEPVPIEQLNPELPDAVVEVVERALAKDAADRFQTAGQFADALFAASQTRGHAAATVEHYPAEAYAPAPAEDEPTHEGQIRRLEEALAARVGPVAKVMVRMAAQQAQSIEALCDQLGQRISDIHESRRFVAEARAIFGLPPPAPPGPVAARPAPSPRPPSPSDLNALAGQSHRPSAPSDLNARAGNAMRKAPAAPPLRARARRFFSGIATLAVLGGVFLGYLYFVKPELLFGLTSTVGTQVQGLNIDVRALSLGSSDIAYPANSPFEARLNRDDRKDIQRALSNLRHYSGPIDGDFGRQTREAIRAYQGQVGIVQTGVLDADVATNLLDRAGLLRPRR